MEFRKGICGTKMSNGIRKGDNITIKSQVLATTEMRVKLSIDLCFFDKLDLVLYN